MEKPRRRRWLKWTLVVLASVTALLGGFLGWVWLACWAAAPELHGRPAVLDAPAPSAQGARVRFQNCWFERRKGCSMLYVEGEPYALGFANGSLTRDLVEAQERSLFATVREFLPGELEFLAVGMLVLVNNRNLPDFVPLEYQYEIRGIADSTPDPFPQYGPRYHRILNYHAAHDIAHWVWDRPAAGCTAFAASGAMTADGALLIGRNFDFEAGTPFDENKIIACYRPERGHAFLSVSWSGMAGAVTGLNDKGIYCSVNGAHSGDKGHIGTPVSIVVRQVLQYAATLDEAVRTIREAHVFVTDSYLVADGKGGAAVVEKTPTRCEVRFIEAGLLLQTNHLLCAGLAEDSGNAEYRRSGTSLPRHARLTELLARHAGRFDPAVAASVLRDRCGPGDTPLSLGHRSSIDALIATHSVIAEPAKGILWVSRGPHCLGAYDAYSIARFGEDIAPPIPADPLLASVRPTELTRARAWVKAAKREWKEEGRLSDAARTRLEEALSLVAGDPTALALLARAREAEGDVEGARGAYRLALEGDPPFREEREEVEAALARLR